MLRKLALAAIAAALLAACGGSDSDKIGKASTVFHMLGKNDRIEVEAFDDPDVQGVACYISYAKKGGLKETVNLEEDASDASVSCVQSANIIRYNEAAVTKPKQVFKRSASVAFKSQQIIRYYDPKRKAFAYLVYSDKIVQGSPKNSLSAISCFDGQRVDEKEITGLANKEVYGACIVEVAAPAQPK
ncbi:CreA family protein [Neisseria sp. CCUG17229]|uniref:CreA family protein n=1 Tax=Neisseria sp. CCUG17229 TaxID=3392036 RepID=UPI003A0FDFA0